MQIGNSVLTSLPGVRLPGPIDSGFALYRPSAADKSLIRQMIKHFSALQDPYDKGFITLESLRRTAFPPAGSRDVPWKLQLIAREFLNHDQLRIMADKDPQSRLDDKYDLQNLEKVLGQPSGPTLPMPRPRPPIFTPAPRNPIPSDQ